MLSLSSLKDLAMCSTELFTFSMLLIISETAEEASLTPFVCSAISFSSDVMFVEIFETAAAVFPTLSCCSLTFVFVVLISSRMFSMATEVSVMILFNPVPAVFNPLSDALMSPTID